MAVALINPNSTQAMTEAMVEAARLAVPDIAFEGWTSYSGPPSIQGAEDGLVATAPFLEVVKKASDNGAEGIIIGCFDDTALEQAANIAACPVIGIGQACYHFAAMQQWRFSVVTTLQVSVPVLECNVKKAGLAHALSRIHASGIPVLELEADPQKAEARILTVAQKAVAEDNIQALILGCGGMVTLTKTIRTQLTIPVLDPVEIAAKCMRWFT